MNTRKYFVLIIQVFVVFVALFTACPASSEIYLTIKGNDTKLSKQPFRINGTFLGVESDSISIPDGNYNLTIPSSNGFIIWIRLKVLNDKISVLESDAHPADSCVEGKSAYYKIERWQRPSVRLNSNLHYQLSISMPSFKKLNESSCFESPSTMSGVIDRNHFILEINSDPSGAEIFIDGRQIGKSNGKFSIPYFNNTKTISIVLRANGYVNDSIKLKRNNNTFPKTITRKLIKLDSQR